MNVTLEQRDDTWLFRLEGEMVLQSAAELKTLLLRWLAAGTNLDLDLARVSEIDITALQVLGAVFREASRRGVKVAARASGVVIATVRDSGFDQVSGFGFERAEV